MSHRNERVPFVEGFIGSPFELAGTVQLSSSPSRTRSIGTGYQRTLYQENPILNQARGWALQLRSSNVPGDFRVSNLEVFLNFRTFKPNTGGLSR